jgi:Transposase IS200 like
VNEKNLKLWIFIEDAATDHASCRQRRIKWPAYGFVKPILLHRNSADSYERGMNVNENIFGLRVLPYRRRPLLGTSRKRDAFLRILNEVRERYQFWLVGYVVTPEHIHLQFSESKADTPSTVMQVLK